MASYEAIRASSRLNSSCESWRPSWVESSRSVGLWKVPTLSARAVRSAALAALGANGSCTCTMSSGSVVSASSIVRATSTGSDAARRRVGENGSTSPTPEHQRLCVGSREQRLVPASAVAQRLAALAHELGGVRRRDDQHPVAALVQLPREQPHVVADLGLGLPGEWAHLRDRKPLFWHADAVYAGAVGAPQLSVKLGDRVQRLPGARAA